MLRFESVTKLVDEAPILHYIAGDTNISSTRFSSYALYTSGIYWKHVLNGSYKGAGRYRQRSTALFPCVVLISRPNYLANPVFGV
jgi:hypothetical protein